MRSYGLAAFATFLGVWLSWRFSPDDQFDTLLAPCETKTSQIDGVWLILLFLLVPRLACLMQFRVELWHFPIWWFRLLHMVM